MLRLFKRTLLTLAIAGTLNTAFGFSLVGPYDAWQLPAIGYNLPYVTDGMGGPMNIAEGYRWNVKTITYGFDPSFLHYFGSQGSNAVVQAITIWNNLPPVSQMTPNLTEFPDDTRRENYQAEALNLVDMKSTVLGILMEEVGLASPERYTWTIRATRTIGTPPVTYYTVIQRNYDPVTGVYSAFVNDALYTYVIKSFLAPAFPTPFVDAVEVPLDPVNFGFTAVASFADALNGIEGESLPTFGGFYTGLTRDDVAGLRNLYSKNNYEVENPLPGTIASASSSGSTTTSAGGGAVSAFSPWTPAGTVGSSAGGLPWLPVGGTNTSAITNLIGSNIVTTALRPGVEKIVFQYIPNNSIFGGFPTTIVNYKDSYITNSSNGKSKTVTQNTQRVQTQPDILFSAGDLGVSPGGAPTPIGFARSISTGWANNAALNTQPGGRGPTAGPGVIQPQVVITFSKIGPFIINSAGTGISFIDQATGSAGFVWGSFDGTTNPPIIYPNGTSIQDLQNQVLDGGP